MDKLTIDPEFRDKIPPLTEDEFSLLEENILSDGAVFSPLVVWDGIILDGHNRYEIIQKHPELVYAVHEVMTDLTQELVDAIIEKVLVYGEGRIEVVLNYNDVFSAMCECVEQMKEAG